MVRSQMGGVYGGFYFPFIYTLFIFVLVANLISMVPYSFALASHLVFIVSLNFFGFFVPEGTPLPLVPVLVLIELLSYTARAISLGLRLSANILSGHLLLSILSGLTLTLMSVSIITFVLGFLPLAGILAIVCLEYAISMIQAYVLSVLTAGYLKDALYLH
ncbi:F1F0 ATP synthase subunit A (mitochondrion) [Saccharomycopsis crataegensis]|uniref:ATP synthase subunit a n=1 Tax=Saccharomycopsis crataegensis TaxID=43959 RepID=A0AAV5QWY4_9ASCO|nr:F1F0 ATP synthase subunit A [Saccharomycopsis crataegensis]